MEESNKTALGEIIRTWRSFIWQSYYLQFIPRCFLRYCVHNWSAGKNGKSRQPVIINCRHGGRGRFSWAGLLYSFPTAAKDYSSSPDMKLKSYRVSMLLKIAFMEAASFFVLVIYLLTAINSMLAAAAIIIIIMLLNRPGAELISHELNLSGDETL